MFLYFSYWTICNTKEKLKLEGREHSHPQQSQTSWLGLFHESGWYNFELSLLNVNRVTLSLLCNRLILLHPFTDACSQSLSEFLPPADSAFHATVEAKNSWSGTGKRIRWKRKEEESSGVLADDKINVSISSRPTSGYFVTPPASCSFPCPARL